MTTGASFRPKGIYPILYAFFDQRGALDRRAWRAEIEAVIAAGAPGIAILGLITEVAALEPSERRALVEWAAEDVAGRVPILATVAGRDLLDYLTPKARFAYADGFLAIPDGPGLGIEVDEAKVAEMAKLGHRWRAPVGATRTERSPNGETVMERAA